MCPPIRPHRAFGQHGRTIRVRRWVMMALTLLILGFRLPGALAATPANTLTIGVHVSLATLGFPHIGSIKGFVYTAPYEDLTLKGG